MLDEFIGVDETFTGNFGNPTSIFIEIVGQEIFWSASKLWIGVSKSVDYVFLPTYPNLAISVFLSIIKYRVAIIVATGEQ